MSEIKLAVTSNANNVDNFSRALSKWGFEKEGDKWTKVTSSKKDIKKTIAFCKSNKLKFFFDNEYGVRSSTYRKEFFTANKKENGEKYRCVYCGRHFPRERITVDHLYPVDRVSKNIPLQNKLKAQGIDSLNAVENLVPACMSCNRKKSNKMGLWIFRGRIGKNETLWKIRWAFRYFVLLVLIYFIVCMFFPQLMPDAFGGLKTTLMNMGTTIKSIFGIR